MAYLPSRTFSFYKIKPTLYSAMAEKSSRTFPYSWCEVGSGWSIGLGGVVEHYFQHILALLAARSTQMEACSYDLVYTQPSFPAWPFGLPRRLWNSG